MVNPTVTVAPMAALNIPAAPVIAGATHLHSGKVRDLYRFDDGPFVGKLLMVASDRVSAFDFVLDSQIPDKGRILTRMSLWWFDQLADLMDHRIGEHLPERDPELSLPVAREA